MVYGAVIIAAGMSTRMQEFKPLMKIGDKTLLECVAGNFEEAGVQKIVVVTGYRAADIVDALKDKNVVCLHNADYETTHMLDSARIGFQYLKDRCDRLFYCPVDVPAFTVGTLMKEMDSSEDVVIPYCHGRPGHPLLFNAPVLPHFIGWSGKRGIRGAYEALPEEKLCRLSVDDVGTIMDADTHADYQHINTLVTRREAGADCKFVTDDLLKKGDGNGDSGKPSDLEE